MTGTVLNQRFPLKSPRIVGRAWADANRELQEFLDSIFEGTSGIPAGFLGTTPRTVLVGTGASPGAKTDGWMAAGAQLTTSAPTVVGGLANASVLGSSTTPAREDHQHKRDVRVKLNGADLATRNAINLITTLGVTDDAGNDEVDIDLSAIAAFYGFDPVTDPFVLAIRG